LVVLGNSNFSCVYQTRQSHGFLIVLKPLHSNSAQKCSIHLALCVPHKATKVFRAAPTKYEPAMCKRFLQVTGRKNIAQSLAFNTLSLFSAMAITQVVITSSCQPPNASSFVITPCLFIFRLGASKTFVRPISRPVWRQLPQLLDSLSNLDTLRRALRATARIERGMSSRSSSPTAVRCQPASSRKISAIFFFVFHASRPILSLFSVSSPSASSENLLHGVVSD